MATDLVHDPEEYRLPLQQFRFLLGHFRGEGHDANGTVVFHKELSGTWEAGGRFIGLRMSVTYPLADGRKDIHDALVMIGVDSASRHYAAQAYTDSGIIHTYQLVWDHDTLSFADQPPTGHNRKGQRARKSFAPTSDGFEERVEVDWGNGDFVPYSSVRMQRVDQ